MHKTTSGTNHSGYGEIKSLQHDHPVNNTVCIFINDNEDVRVAGYIDSKSPTEIKLLNKNEWQSIEQFTHYQYVLTEKGGFYFIDLPKSAKAIPSTTSLDDSKKLKELGIKQGYSEYFWSDHLADPGREATGEVERMRLHSYVYEERVPKEHRWAAFTIEELKVMVGFGFHLKETPSALDDLAKGLINEIENYGMDIAAINNRLHRYRCPDAPPFCNVPLNEHAGHPQLTT